jgi:hypothetical protein
MASKTSACAMRCKRCTPKDLILSSAMAADDGDQMAVTFNYKDTNNTNIVLSTAEAGTIRFYAGTYDTENV